MPNIVFDSTHQTHPRERVQPFYCPAAFEKLVIAAGVNVHNRDDRKGTEWREDDSEEGLHAGLAK